MNVSNERYKSRAAFSLTSHLRFTKHSDTVRRRNCFALLCFRERYSVWCCAFLQSVGCLVELNGAVDRVALNNACYVCEVWVFDGLFEFFRRNGYVLFDCGDFRWIPDGLIAYEPRLVDCGPVGLSLDGFEFGPTSDRDVRRPSWTGVSKNRSYTEGTAQRHHIYSDGRWQMSGNRVFVTSAWQLEQKTGNRTWKLTFFF